MQHSSPSDPDLIRAIVPERLADCGACAASTGDEVPEASGTVVGRQWGLVSVPTACTGHDSCRVTLTEHGKPTVEVTVRMDLGFNGGSPATNDFIVYLRQAAFTHIFGHDEIEALARFAALVQAGLPAAQETLVWAYARFGDPEQVRAAVEAGMSAEDAYAWMNRFANTDRVGVDLVVDPALCVQWWKATDDSGQPVGIDGATDWIIADVTAPDRRPPGLSPQDVLRLLYSGIEGRDPGFAGVAVVCPRLIRAGLRHGATPAEVVALFAALGPGPFPANPDEACYHDGHEALCGWRHALVDEIEATVPRLAGLDWIDLSTCVRVGLPLAEAERHVRTGREMGPVRLLAGLSG